MVTHYDLFAGIGGFSIAVDEVFDEPVRHIFCEWEKFPTEVLKKHWPEGEFWGDIAELVAHTERSRRDSGGAQVSSELRKESISREESKLRNKDRRPNRELTIVTGGFPCQPFSQAGQRRGTADNRYKWPEMFEVIRNVSPDWVIAENVAGLVSWSEGMVLEQVCTDLEGEGYEVWPLVIPAVAVNAPHRRDRVWIVANRPSQRCIQREKEDNRSSKDETADRPVPAVKAAANPAVRRRRQCVPERKTAEYPSERGQWYGWNENWATVATELCSLDDGLPARMGDTTITKARHRQEQLKAYGNAIVPQVAIEILRAIKGGLK